ncbi:McrB family protein [Nocardioides sp.]|uniref:McrB family protein n=1 Tax=Nocardioides sp. TaxID=35761 RepID=UPI002EDAE739
MELIEHRAKKIDLLRAAAAADPEVQPDWAERDRLRPARARELRAILEDLRTNGDIAAFKGGLDSWARRPGPFAAFQGFGLMWMNQVVNYAVEDGLDPAPVLADALHTPTSVEEAERKLADLESFVSGLSRNGHPAKARIPFVVSLFWSTDPDDPTWPCLWPSAFDALIALGWTLTRSQRETYPAFRELAAAACPANYHELDRLLWWHQHRGAFPGLEDGLTELCSEAAALMEQFELGRGYPDPHTETNAHAMAAHLRGALQTAGAALLSELEAASRLDLELAKLQLRTAFSSDKPYRADAYAMLSMPGGMGAPGFRLWVTRSGVAFGAYAGWQQGDHESGRAAIERARGEIPEWATFFAFRPHHTGDRLQPVADYENGEVFVGRWWPGTEALGRSDLAGEMRAAAADLAPVLRAFAGSGEEPTASLSDELAALAAEFKRSRPYPTDRDELNRKQREEMASALSPDGLEVLDTDMFRKLINGKRYGNPGPQSVLNSSMAGLDGTGLTDFSSKLREFLWGDDPVELRLDRVLDWNDLGMRGLGESVAFKLLAVSQPDRFLPVFPLKGEMGKLAMLQRLGIPLPSSAGKSVGTLHVEANDLLRRNLEPAFPGDPWAMAQFGYWLLDRQQAQQVDPERDLLKEAADDLLVEVEFLREIYELLEERGQVVFYGPPGTGKTFLADRFARAVQPDASRRALVQFHPSTSYEDFFEGYRPVTDANGQLVYELRKGPLALIAEAAEASPSVPHLLIIDEINRANLPRALGELLFLLEYRNHTVRTIYRPDEPFELPKNLWIIGTMNTADRSIAMVDAALRRRFDFIPFMPHEGPMQGLLRSWLERENEPLWVADLVDAVNERLIALLGGPHLQIGHSHFMKKGLTPQRLERIWRYNVHPMIEDQLYGRSGELAWFDWNRLVKDFASVGSSSPVEPGEATEV